MDTEKPSATARFVASGLWCAVRRFHRASIIPDSLAGASNMVFEALNASTRLCSTPTGRALFGLYLRFLEWASIPGIFLYFGLRKRIIAELAQDFLSTHSKNSVSQPQLVVLGGGYDTLALRIAREYPHARVFETDHPATQKVKRRIVAALETPLNLTLVPFHAELQRLPETLRACEGYDPTAPTLCIAEGLFMYLREKDVATVFRDATALSSGPLRVIFTYMIEEPKGDYHFKNARFYVRLWLWLKKETFLWGVPRRELPTFLKNLGFRISCDYSPDDLRSQYLQSIAVPLAQGEHVAMAERV